MNYLLTRPRLEFARNCRVRGEKLCEKWDTLGACLGLMENVNKMLATFQFAGMKTVFVQLSSTNGSCDHT